LKFTSEIQKFRTRNPAIQGMDFYVKNALKLTYEHLGYENFLRGLCPLYPQGGKGRKRGGWGGDERERKGGGGVGKGRAKEMEREGRGRGRGRDGNGREGEE
jgi:hypothetical protein